MNWNFFLKLVKYMRYKMFRIVDNADGSTTVFCSETGQVICSVPKRVEKKKPVAILRPMPREPISIKHLSPTSANNRGTKRSPTSQLSILKFESDPPQRDSFDDISSGDELSLPPFEPEYPDVDYSEDCITTEEFHQTLGLITKKRLSSTPMKDLMCEFPFRHISKAPKKESEFDIPPETKVHEDVELSSPLGQKWLKSFERKPQAISSKYLMDEPTTLMCIKKYDNYCRFALASPYLNGCNFPKLRCRENKNYQISFRPLKSWGNGSHSYSFNRRQRRERIRVLETGLSKRSRRLKRLCQPCSVNLRVLAKSTIKKWTERKHLEIPLKFVHLNSMKVYIEKGKQIALTANGRLKLSSDRNGGRVLPSQTGRNTLKQQGSSLPVRNIFYNCTVSLKDIRKRLEYRLGVCYVRGTSIKVNENKPEPKPFGINTFHSYALPYNSTSQIPNHDHAYHRQHMTIVHLGGPVNGSRVVNLVPLPKCSELPSQPSSAVPQKKIPVVDITSDDDDNSKEEQNKSNSRAAAPHDNVTYVFRCFGCSLKQAFNNKREADALVQQHMVGYHSVMQPELFLEAQPDKTNRCVFIEAFPGYKSNLAL